MTKSKTKKPVVTVYLLMDEVDPIGVYYNKIDAQNAAITYDFLNYTITEMELV
jgi:hypothetical protein